MELHNNSLISPRMELNIDINTVLTGVVVHLKLNELVTRSISFGMSTNNTRLYAGEFDYVI